MQVIYRYFAIKPIRAEHPVGSGKIVEYTPGQEIPASEWGRAADNLVELQKAARVAFNIPEDGDEPFEEIDIRVGIQPEPEAEVEAPKAPGRPKKAQ